MNKTSVCLALCALMALGCEPTPSTPEVTKEPAVAPPTAPTPESQPSTALEQLDAMDTRKPVPLQPMMAWHQKQNMMQHLVAIQRITSALPSNDWREVIDAAGLIESSPSMAQMCDHMGAGAPGFTAMALDFHTRADAISPAAKAQDKDGVLRAVGHTLQACTSCHSTWKQKVVDAKTWTKLTESKQSPSPSGPSTSH